MKKHPNHQRQTRRKAEMIADYLRLWAHPARFAVLCRLWESEASVSELERLVDLSQPALSQHLALMREHDLVGARREGKLVIYYIKNKNAKPLLASLHKIFCK